MIEKSQYDNQHTQIINLLIPPTSTPPLVFPYPTPPHSTPLTATCGSSSKLTKTKHLFSTTRCISSTKTIKKPFLQQ